MDKKINSSRSYQEIMNDLQTAKYGKECRQLHKELKQINRKNGLPLFTRYPNLPEIITTIVATMILAGIFLPDL